MLNLLTFLAESNAGAVTFAIIRYVLAVLIFLCAGFIIFIIMRQSGNTDGMEALSGSSKREDSESYYGKNKGKSPEATLRLWTYICAGFIAVAAIVFLILG